jgi:tRNA(Leu) C34 or U34 (ribose-2'-O)-methylase TrmL
MAIGSFALNEQPSAPVYIDVSETTLPHPLQDYAELELESTPDAPLSTPTVVNSNEFYFTFTLPLSEPGVFWFRLKATHSAGVDYTSWLSYEVLPDPSTLLVSEQQAYLITTKPVSATELFNAQAKIANLLGQELSTDPDSWFDQQLASDKRRIRSAIAFFAADTSVSNPPGVKAATYDGASVTYADPPATGVMEIPPLVLLQLNQLSWNKRKKTITPTLGYDYEDRRIAYLDGRRSPFMNPVSRPPLDEDYYWSTLGERDC